MKKRILAAILAMAIMAGFIGVIAAGTAGTSSDPLVSLSYLTGTFKTSLLTQAQTDINSELNSAYNAAVGQIPAGSAYSVYDHTSVPMELDLKYGDTVSGQTGTMYMLLAGSARLVYTGTAVVDVTAGKVVSSGTSLAADHRYLVAEDTCSSLTVTGDTAAIQVEADYLNALSTATDYYAITDILYSLGLFKGDGTAYGKGYALERTATRLEGVIMFIRLLGEENAALSYTGSHPFTDVPKWAKSYVAYAYSKGYTNGVGYGKFGTNDTLTAQHYVTFIMRALGYAEGSDFAWATALSDAVRLGVITSAENASFAESAFYRSRVAYLSYFTLSANLCGSDSTLLNKLISSGSVRSDAAQLINSAALSRIR